MTLVVSGVSWSLGISWSLRSLNPLNSFVPVLSKRNFQILSYCRDVEVEPEKHSASEVLSEFSSLQPLCNIFFFSTQWILNAIQMSFRG